MRVALVIGKYDAVGGGAERWTDRHARQLLARGHDVHLVARDFSGLPERAIPHQVILPKGLRRLPRLAFADRAERLLRDLSADVVHDMGDGWHFDLFMPHHGTRRGGFERNSAMVPKAWQWTRPLAWRTLPRYREFAQLEARQYAPGPRRHFIALSRAVAGHMRDYYRVAPGAIAVVPNGVDTNWFTPAPDARIRALMRRKLGFDNATIFLIIAHNFRLKGVDELLQATAAVARKRSIAVVVAGDGPLERYRKLVKKLSIATAVRFVGTWPDPRPLYRAADVYVQPTYYDPCSLVALEALACGLPVITTRHNGAGELMTDGQHGYIVADPSDVARLADRMLALCDAQQRDPMAVAARSLALECSQDRNLAAIENLYFQAVPQRMAA